MYRIKSVQINVRGLWQYLAIFFFILFFYYFFTERLPWFWDDDVYWIREVKNVSPLALAGRALNFLSGGYFYRPTFEMYVKFCNLFFNEDPHYYRMTKVIILSIISCLMLYLTVKHGGSKFITILNLSVFATLPSVVIANSWISDTETVELLFKVSSFIVFFALISEGEKKISLRFIVLSVILIIFIVFADKAKATAKLIPAVFLTYLILTRNKRMFLYAIVLVSIFTVFPRGFLSAKPFDTNFYINLFKTFLSHVWPLLMFSLIIILSTKNKVWLKNRFVLFALLWLIYEIIFYKLYPSNEMRYLFSSLAATSIFLSALISNIFANTTGDKFKKIAGLMFIFITLSMLVFNSYWSYNFRGSFANLFITTDKKIKFIDQNFKSSLCIYSNFTQLYYTWNTSNLYVNINPNNSWNKKYDEIYLRNSQEIKILNPEKYERIIVLDESIVARAGLPAVLFNSVIQNSLYELFQGKMNFKIRTVNLYNISLGGYTNYPHYSWIYFMK